MNTLKLKKLRLKNFKGVKTFETYFETGDNYIYGDNETGKTTLVDAFYWLSFNKDSSGKSDFQLKPVDSEGKEINNLDTEVEAEIIHNDTRIVLMKRFREKWTKKRGSATKEFTGHETKYFIDEVPSKKKEFDAKINEIINIDIFKLVTNPFGFNSLHWEKRREILIEMCGDIPDEQIIKSNNELACMSDVTGSKTIDDIKKIIKEKHKLINDELKEIPVRIDELATTTHAEQPSLETKKTLDETLKKLQSEMYELKNDESISKKQIRINMIESEIIKIKQEAENKSFEKRSPLTNRIQEIELEIINVANSIRSIETDIFNNENRNKADEQDIMSLRDKWHTENEKSLNTEDVCPTCGQDLPEDKIKESVEKFNVDKANRLQEITDEGKKLSESVKKRTDEIKKLKAYLEEKQKELSDLNSEKKEKENDLNKTKEVEIDTAELGLEKMALEDEIQEIKNNKSGAVEEIQEKIDDVQDGIDTWNNINASFKQYKKSQKRIDELKAKEKELAAEHGQLESELNLIEKFIVKKVEMLDEKINSHFSYVRFNLFKQQINGGIEECCEATHNGVPFDHGLNNAARINSGLDIINSLSKFYGFSAPVWIDNRESVTKLIDVDTQVINLVVSKDHKELTVL